MTKDEPQTSHQISAILEQLHSPSDEDFEAAFDVLRNDIEAARPYLLRAMTLADDPKVKGALLELMGNTRDPDFVPYIENQLESEDVRIRFWAYVALQNISTPAARRILNEVDLHTLRRRRYYRDI